LSLNQDTEVAIAVRASVLAAAVVGGRGWLLEELHWAMLGFLEKLLCG
jgi:hypothetical protein